MASDASKPTPAGRNLGRFPHEIPTNSLIPLEIWKASPTTIDDNEKARRNINCDGLGLTLLGGIMRGFHYDKNACAASILVTVYLPMLSKQNVLFSRQVMYTKSLPLEGNTSFAFVRLTPPPDELQSELVPNLPPGYHCHPGIDF
ncbi:uncharacterized protein EDB93DRAFT_1106420 [Suillus bovinus]|uniref:uncharacterized protein n=1 Tax=Suillus bovinus TaxID=48563 RepID=UPI001B86329F|nr:uncharacterized protein EDB93DRAFT_1106420 [Suillus bovinus]KAG2138049.1 hypothetical protein EDB93DRAFT_1106420 [Suillus bovinus]